MPKWKEDFSIDDLQDGSYDKEDRHWKRSDDSVPWKSRKKDSDEVGQRGQVTPEDRE
jgi:hypothetical protein